MDKPTGELRLVFRKKQDGTTGLAEQYYKLPLQIMRTHYQDNDGTAFVYMLNPSGGVLQHDRLYTEIVLEEEAKALVTNPSTTKFYKMDEGHAQVINKVVLGPGAVLEYLPEHNVPFAESEAYQENEFILDKDSVLIATDMVTAGRTTRNEIFDYRLYWSKTRIYVDGELKLYDSSRMEPDKTEMKSLGLMEGHLSNGAVYVYCSNISDSLPEKINSFRADDISIAAGKLDDSLMIVRFTGSDIIRLKETINDVWAVIRREVLGKEPVRIRKY